MSKADHGYTLLRWVMGIREDGETVSDDEAKDAAFAVARDAGHMETTGRQLCEPGAWADVSDRVWHAMDRVVKVLDDAGVAVDLVDDAWTRIMRQDERVAILATELDGARAAADSYRAANTDLQRKLREARETREEAEPPLIDDHDWRWLLRTMRAASGLERTEVLGRHGLPGESVEEMVERLVSERDEAREAADDAMRDYRRADEAAASWRTAAQTQEAASRTISAALARANAELDAARAEAQRERETAAATREAQIAARKLADSLSAMLERCRDGRDEDREARRMADADALAAVGVDAAGTVEPR